MNTALLLILPAFFLPGQASVPRATGLEVHVEPALAGDEAAIEALRDAGIRGVDAFRKDANPADKRYDTALDRVCGQRDCRASGLFWYTDFERAKTAARSQGKPILTLRLLGRLDEDLSCANSRFFRTTLYSNQAISQFLRENFILHWKSVRPVPRITIDMGDGRKIERTIAGNSAHYVLDANGRLVDGIPGLYGPPAFLRVLGEARTLARATANLPEEERIAALHAHHVKRSAAITRAWHDDVEKVSPGKIARSGGMKKAMDEETWRKVAMLHDTDARLDRASHELIAGKYAAASPRIEDAMPIAVTKSVAETPMMRQIRTFESSIGLDTIMNEYLLHRRIHDRLASPPASIGYDVEKFNEWVYDELFLTPMSDPWLGMIPNDAFSALPQGGVISSR